MTAKDQVVIISGCRTPVGKFQGSLSDLSATQLGAIVVREAVKRAGVDPAQVDECIMGNVVSAGLGQNPARQAAIYGGLSPEVGAMTINKVCGSGLKAVALAAQAIQTGDSTLVVAGGMESMTNAPYLLPQARKGLRLGDAQIVDSMIHDGLWDVYNDYHMGLTGENVAEKYGITREEQDEFAVNSHRKAVAAIKECRFKSQDRSRRASRKEERRGPGHFRQRRISARRHHHRNPALAETGFQKRWHRHRRQRSRSERRRGRRGCDQRRARRKSWARSRWYASLPKPPAESNPSGS